jgi:hypothetical protein
LTELLDLHALLLDFLLLLLNLGLGLLVCNLVVLHRVADRKARHTAQSAADSCTGARMMYGCAD